MTDTHEAERLAELLSADPTESPVSLAAAVLLRRIPELEAELEAAKLGEATHDRQATEYAQRVAHWIGKFDEVKAERDQLRAELEKVRWQPIETAPRGSGMDGPKDTRHADYVQPPNILLWTEEGPLVGYYDWYYHPGYGLGAAEGESVWRNSEGGRTYGVTHWMPLPAAPTPPHADQKGQ